MVVTLGHSPTQITEAELAIFQKLNHGYANHVLTGTQTVVDPGERPGGPGSPYFQKQTEGQSEAVIPLLTDNCGG